MARHPRQLELPVKNRRTGRPRIPGSVSHRARPVFDGAKHPLHVTVRMAPDVPNLRSQRGFRCVEHALREEKKREDLRITQFSIQGNHLHLIVEADDRRALARRMQGFAIRLARRVNRDLMRRRRGRVVGQRYHARVLRTPREVRHALAYVLFNHAKHGIGTTGVLDPYSSAPWFVHFARIVRAPRWSPCAGPPPMAEPSLWMLTTGWRRAGLVANPFG